MIGCDALSICSLFHRYIEILRVKLSINFFYYVLIMTGIILCNLQSFITSHSKSQEHIHEFVSQEQYHNPSVYIFSENQI